MHLSVCVAAGSPDADGLMAASARASLQLTRRLGCINIFLKANYILTILFQSLSTALALRCHILITSYTHITYTTHTFIQKHTNTLTLKSNPNQVQVRHAPIEMGNCCSHRCRERRGAQQHPPASFAQSAPTAPSAPLPKRRRHPLPQPPKVKLNKFVGTMDKYRVRGGDFAVFCDEFQVLMRDNRVDDDQLRLAYLVKFGGRPMIGIVRTLRGPDNFYGLTFAQLLDELRVHFQRKLNPLSARLRFNQRIQLPDETTDEFFAELRRLALFCKFDAYLETALRDRFLTGLLNKKVQYTMMKDPKLTLHGLLDVARTMNGELDEVEARERRQVRRETTSLADEQRELHRRYAVWKLARPLDGDLWRWLLWRVQRPTRCSNERWVCNFCKRHGHLSPDCERRRV